MVFSDLMIQGYADVRVLYSGEVHGKMCPVQVQLIYVVTIPGINVGKVKWGVWVRCGSNLNSSAIA